MRLYLFCDARCLTIRLGDDDTDRKTQAEVLLNAYNRELERQRAAAGPGGLFQVEGIQF